MEGLTVLLEQDKLGCSNAKFVFGWKGLDEGEIKSHAKYCADEAHARSVLEAKPRLKENALLAVAVSPLALALRHAGRGALLLRFHGRPTTWWTTGWHRNDGRASSLP